MHSVKTIIHNIDYFFVQGLVQSINFYRNIVYKPICQIGLICVCIIFYIVYNKILCKNNRTGGPIMILNKLLGRFSCMRNGI